MGRIPGHGRLLARNMAQSVWPCCVLILVFFLFFPIPRTLEAGEKPGAKGVRRSVSLDVRAMPLREVLERIAQQAKVVIFVFDGIEGKQVTAHFEQGDPAYVLSRLMRGNSYAVIYPERDRAAGVHYLLSSFSPPLAPTGTIGSSGHEEPPDAASVLETLLRERESQEDRETGREQEEPSREEPSLEEEKPEVSPMEEPREGGTPGKSQRPHLSIQTDTPRQ